MNIKMTLEEAVLVQDIDGCQGRKGQEIAVTASYKNSEIGGYATDQFLT